MKKLLLLFACALTLTTASSQITIRIGKHEAPTGWSPATRSNFASVSEAKHYAQEIIDVVGLKPNFEVMASTSVPNAAAVVYGGKRYVLYNPNFINSLVQKTGNKWAAVSVLAHEIGHHLNGHTVSGTGSQPAIELEADEFSGFVLRKMGASLSDAQAAMKILASQYASKTHPAQHDRLASIGKGWNTADAQMSGRDVAKVPEMKVPAPARQPQRTTTQRSQQTSSSVISSRDIIANIRFNADPSSSYYVTTAYNIVKVTNNRLYIVGKLAKMNSRSYPYVIYDQDTRLYVNSSGSIVSREGREVGRLKAA